MLAQACFRRWWTSATVLCLLCGLLLCLGRTVLVNVGLLRSQRLAVTVHFSARAELPRDDDDLASAIEGAAPETPSSASTSTRPRDAGRPGDLQLSAPSSRPRAVAHSASVVLASISNSRSLCDFRQRFSAVSPERERAVYLIGDSTFRNQFDALCFAAEGSIQVYDVTWLRAQWELWTCAGRLGEMPLFLAYSATPTFSEDVGRMMHSVLSDSHPPTVIYFGSGLWLQWPSNGANPDEWSFFDWWRSYEVQFKRVLGVYSALSAQLAVATTHSQCESAFHGRWSQVAAAAASDASAAIEPCVDYLTSRRADVAPDEARSACRDGLRGSRGSELLSQRLRRALAVSGREAGEWVELRTPQGAPYYGTRARAVRLGTRPPPARTLSW